MVERVIPSQEKCGIYSGASRSVIVEQQLDKGRLREDLTNLRAQGIKSIAVALMHSYW